MRLADRFDQATLLVIAAAKAIARRQAERYLDTIHVLEAACATFPETVEACLRETGRRRAPLPRLNTPAEPVVNAPKMCVTTGFRAVVAKLSATDNPITLSMLLAEIVRHAGVRVTMFLDRDAAARPSPRADLRPSGYPTRRDWLRAIAAEWQFRRHAVRRCRDRSADYKPAEHFLDRLSAISAANRARAVASHRSRDPLTPLELPASDSILRGVSEALLVDELFDLELHPFGGASVRDLSLMLEPAVFPRNCAAVDRAVRHLLDAGLSARRDDGSRLGDPIRLTDVAVNGILQHFEHDVISRDELLQARRTLDHGIDW